MKELEVELTDKQRQALQAEPGKPVHVVDPATSQHYVLLAQEQYERIEEQERVGQPQMGPVCHVHRRRRIHSRPLFKPAPQGEGHAEDGKGHGDHRQCQTKSNARAPQAAGEVGDFAPL